MSEMDIVILSNAHTPQLKELTEQTIATCKASDSIVFNFIVIEQQSSVKYSERTVHLREPFNYNRFMNYGIKEGKGEYIALCNNDLIFHKEWASNIIAAMQKHKLLSACPVCPNTQGNKYKGRGVVYGYEIREQVSGWCIVIKRSLLEIIGEIQSHDELPFWYSDNLLMRQLQKHGIKHALIPGSVVEHIGSKTIHTRRNAGEWMQGSWPRFKELCDAGVV